jgi:hypothetical protein
MPDSDVLTRRLQELGALGAADLRGEAVRSRVRLAVDAEIETEQTGRRRAPRRTLVWHRRGALVSAACVLIAVAVVAVVLVSGRSGTRDLTPAHPGAADLIARLAVLRRPQTDADRLPAHLRLRNQSGTIIPGLTRRVFDRDGVRIYLAVSTPDARPSAPWPAHLGDQVSLVSVRGNSSIQNVPFPAVDLDDATHIAVVGPLLVDHHLRVPLAQIVPDGVVRVRWRYGAGTDATTAVTDNVALTPLAERSTPRATTWLAADGTVVPTSSAARQRVASEDRRREARADIRELLASRTVAPPNLLAGFAVFGDGGRSSFTRDGITVTRPTLADLPLPILDAMRQGAGPAAIDSTQVRQVRTRSGHRLWVVPGSDGLCVEVLEGARTTIAADPFETLGAAAGGTASGDCSGSVSLALSGGVGESGIAIGKADYAAGVVPRDHPTTTVRGRDGRRRTIRPPLGVYFTRIPGR